MDNQQLQSNNLYIEKNAINLLIIDAKVIHVYFNFHWMVYNFSSAVPSFTTLCQRSNRPFPQVTVTSLKTDMMNCYD